MLALLYLFFVRVMWAVWSELRSPAVARAAATGVDPERERRPRRPSSTAIATLHVVEPLEGAGAEYPVVGELTIGRSPGCAIVIDDTYVSQQHARIFPDGDAHSLEDLGSTNGTILNGRLLTEPAVLRLGDRIQVGGTVLEVA